MSDAHESAAGRAQGESIAFVIAMLVIGCAGMYYIGSLFAPAFFALTLVITVRPLVSWATRRHVPRPVAALIAILIIFAFVIGLFAALGVAIVQLIDTLPGYSAQFSAIWDSIRSLLARAGVDETTLIDQVSQSMDTNRIVSVAQSLLGQVTNVGSVLSVMGLTVVFLMFDTARIEARSRALSRLRPGIATALKGFASSVRSYWLVSTVFGLIVAVLDVIALWILNVPMAVTWGVVSFITNYIPNIGFVLGVIPPALIALVASGPWTALWVVVAYCVLNFVIQSLIQPKFTGDAVGLNTTTTFLSLLFWSQVIGALGTILAVPLTLFVKALLVDSDPRLRWINVFLAAGDSDVDDDGRGGSRDAAEGGVDASDPGSEREESVGAVSDDVATPEPAGE
ncbi:AI-2E family transporter [Actinomyces ruminicola]|uniref:Predicted PurR-regulated permease PerM n=1 Tax=Actinomyces ruminicola TaxID=332524 RepID=A0A1G9Z2F7_9ACTO|nr:AI-2E family transporter [Actinomyces ruminicola]SDN14931.1 Predicted PurR-regulated permease PerM [Actinomyces ruminicola]